MNSTGGEQVDWLRYSGPQLNESFGTSSLPSLQLSHHQGSKSAQFFAMNPPYAGFSHLPNFPRAFESPHTAVHTLPYGAINDRLPCPDDYAFVPTMPFELLVGTTAPQIERSHSSASSSSTASKEFRQSGSNKDFSEPPIGPAYIFEHEADQYAPRQRTFIACDHCRQRKAKVECSLFVFDGNVDHPASVPALSQLVDAASRRA
jgi:hypothetical protein